MLSQRRQWWSTCILSVFSSSFVLKSSSMSFQRGQWWSTCILSVLYLVPVLVFLFFVFSTRFKYCLVLLFSFVLVLLALWLPRFGKRELIVVLFLCLFDLRLFDFVCFFFLLVSWKGCGLCLLALPGLFSYTFWRFLPCYLREDNNVLLVSCPSSVVLLPWRVLPCLIKEINDVLLVSCPSSVVLLPWRVLPCLLRVVNDVLLVSTVFNLITALWM